MSETRTPQDSAISLTDQERDAGLDLQRLKELVGLVDYDASSDPFPVTGWDAVVFIVGNATQAAHYYQSVWGMELIAYTGPEHGTRDHKAFVLKSGSIKFVLKGAVSPDSRLIAHHAKHGDGVLDIGLEVPDVDQCIAQAKAVGARILEAPHTIEDEKKLRIPAVYVAMMAWTCWQPVTTRMWCCWTWPCQALTAGRRCAACVPWKVASRWSPSCRPTRLNAVSTTSLALRRTTSSLNQFATPSYWTGWVANWN